MIVERELSLIGHTLKPHGINGEISATISGNVNIDSLQCIVLDIDSIYVPFFINSYRARGSEAVLLTIDGISDEIQAAQLCGLDIFALRKDIGEDVAEDEEDGFYLSDLIEFNLLDVNGKTIGQIIGYDDSTANTLLTITLPDGNNIFVPIADELVQAIDFDNKTITVDLPDGILEL